MDVRLVSYTRNPIFTAERAAAKCYNSTPSMKGAIIDACYKSGHLSVMEHMSFTFDIRGISRVTLAQLTRHRIASFSVRSQRYCSESNSAWICPPSIQKGNQRARDVFNASMKASKKAYNELRDLGVPQEDARYVLPEATCTELVCTMNMRELINFCNLRLCNRAQWEIRELAKEMRRVVGDAIPLLKKYLKPRCEANRKHPYCPEEHSCGKHKTLDELWGEGEEDEILDEMEQIVAPDYKYEDEDDDVVDDEDEPNPNLD